MKIISVVGARPNLMKIAPFIRAINSYNDLNKQKIEHILVHTGQHYDDRMSSLFFEELKIPAPDINLGVGSGSHAYQVGQTMIEFEKVLKDNKPDWVVVVGDVNATLACSVTAKKENIRCCHIEAGLRSGDMTMPEEINRLVTDRLSDLLLTPDWISSENLIKEGVNPKKIKFVGNIMIDTLLENLKEINIFKSIDIIRNNLHADSNLSEEFSLQKFAVVTIHRPSNVDDFEALSNLFNFIANDITKDLSVIWPVHPRTEKKLKEFNLWEIAINKPNLYLLYPVGYLEMLRLNQEATIMLTDSGGLQEECCILGTPCITLRYNTERPITLKSNGGVSVLVGNDLDNVRKEYYVGLKQQKQSRYPELWDGKTAERCVEAILDFSL